MSKKQWKQANSYARERAKLAQKAVSSRDSSYFEEVRKIHDFYFAELEKDIRAFESRYATKEGIDLAEVKKRISEMDVQAFGEKAKRYVEEKNFSNKANEELRLYNLKMKVSRLELLQYEMSLNMVALADEEYKLAEKFLNQEYVDTLKEQAGILGMSVGSSQTVKAKMDGIINTPFKNVTWSNRIWDRQEALRDIVQKVTGDLVLRGKNPTVAIPQLRKEFDVSVYEAKRLAVTEGARVQIAVQKASFEQMGFEEYEYIAEPRACAICKPMDGKHFKVADMQSGLNASPMHPFCRCSTAAHYTGREKKIEEEDIPIPESAPYKNIKKEWLNHSGVSKVSERTYWRHEDNTYSVDGKNVVLDYSSKEKEVADWLADTFNRHVELVPRVNFPQGVPTPDYLVDGLKFDLKEITGNGKETLDKNTRKARKQAENIIFDVTKSPLTDKQIFESLSNIYRSKRRGLDRAIVKRNDNLIFMMQKKS